MIGPATPGDVEAASSASRKPSRARAIGSAVGAEPTGDGRRAAVAVVGDGLAGCAVTVLAGGTAGLAGVAAEPQRRRTGLATAMLGDLWGRAVRDGAERMQAEVAAGSAAGLAHYLCAGFTEVARRRRYHRGGGDAVALAHWSGRVVW
jgi:ribosomal-protein-alanine N-acetyltransferase